MPTFSDHLFWDCDPATIDFEAHRRFVIARVLTRGRTSDWNELKRFYGVAKLGEEVVHLRDLDPRTEAFCAAYFDIPREHFRCHSKNPSSSPAPARW